MSALAGFGGWEPNAVSIHDLRNIGILAHIDAGKTTLTERVLFYSGVISMMGEVHDGTTVTDWMPQEQERGITITAASISCEWEGKRINLIDTPGHVDFTVEVERSLRILDGAVAVISATEGVQSQTEAVWRQARQHGIPVLVFVNKMDREGADLLQAVADIEARLDVEGVLFQIPIFEEERFVGVVDLVGRQSLRFDEKSKGVVVAHGPIPEELVEEAEIAREMLLDTILLDNDPVTDRYLLEGEIGPEDIWEAAARGVAKELYVPVFCGSALKNAGIQPLLDAIVHLLPSPATRPPERVEVAGERVPLDVESDEALAAMIFKRVIDPRIGSVTTLRVFAGTLRVGQEVLNSRTGERIVIGRLVRMLANEPEDVEKVGPGDIASVVDMPVQGTGDTLCHPEYPICLEPMTFPQPVAVIALEAATPEDSEALEKAVVELVEEDPTLRLAVDAHSGQLLVRGVGELQLEVLSERIRQDYRIHCRASKPQVSYQETLAGQVKSRARFSKLIEGRQEQVSLAASFSPSERGVGIRVIWGADLLRLKKDFLRATEEGLRAGLRGAGSDGLDVVDVEVEVLELTDLEGTKNELAFQWVGRECVRKAMAECKTIRLEPQMKVEIVTPDDYMGPVVGDLHARRGKVSQVLARAKHQVIVATVPLSTMFGYASDLRSLTQGRASFTMQFNRYESVVSPSETSV